VTAELVKELRDFDTECGDGFHLEGSGFEHEHDCPDFQVMRLRLRAAAELERLERALDVSCELVNDSQRVVSKITGQRDAALEALRELCNCGLTGPLIDKGRALLAQEKPNE
jgi:hypothetical protein